jgi:DNA-binding SARP family transcriptional activator/DNA-binding beta-propeller fold protein YncE
VEYRILGPLEVLEEGRPLGLGSLKERMVLAVLLLHANELVSRERLIDELWGVAPPATARKAVNVYVSKLRKALAVNGDDPIATADGGYRLVVSPDLLDADRMRSLVTEARERMAEGESEAASRVLQDALACWRGPTLAGLQLESFGREEVVQLDELRLTVLIDRIDCDLAQGRHEHVLGELQVLVGEHPLRERLRAQQMLALYRADRQADALDAYQRARHALIDELGIEPSESLQRLQQAILRHDSALEAPTGTAGANGATPAPLPTEDAALAAVPPRSRSRWPTRRRRYLVAAGLVVVAAFAALVAFLSTRGGGVRPPSSPVSSVGPDSVAQIDPGTGKVVGAGGGGPKPGPMALVGDWLWTVARGNGTIGRYDFRTRHGRPPLQLGPALDDIAVDPEGHAWVSDRKPVVTWIGHVTDGTSPYETPVVSTLRIGVPLRGAGAEAVGAGYLWVISDRPGRTGESVSLVDLSHRRLSSTIHLGRQTTAIAYGYRAAWIGAYDAEHSAAWLLKVRPGSNPIESLRLETDDGAGLLSVAVGEGSVWVITSRGDLLGIDPRTLQVVHRIPMSAQEPTLLAVGAGSVWTANHTGYSVSKIDPRTNKIVRTIPIGRYDAIPCGIKATRSAVFVATGEADCG